MLAPVCVRYLTAVVSGARCQIDVSCAGRSRAMRERLAGWREAIDRGRHMRDGRMSRPPTEVGRRESRGGREGV